MMSEVAVAPPSPLARSKSPIRSPKKASKKIRKPAKPSAHPPYAEMIGAAILGLKERGGSSRQAIEKYIKANYKVSGDVGTHLKMALKRGTTSGRFIHTKGKGASGSFKVGAKAKTAAKPKKKVVKKKPVKKVRARKQTAAKKKAAKKPVKSPKKKAIKKTKPSAAKKAVKAKKAAKVKSPGKLKPKKSAKNPKRGPAKKKTTKKAARSARK